MVADRDESRGERDESPEEQTDRNFAELLQELRVAQTGVQILFAFLLTLPFTQRFVEISGQQRTLYGLVVGVAVLALACLVSPVAAHRLTFRSRRKEAVLQVSHWMTLAGLMFMGLAILGGVWLAIWTALGRNWGLFAVISLAVVLIACWLVLPLVVRHQTSLEQ